MTQLVLALGGLATAAAAHATQLNVDTDNGSTDGNRVAVFGLGDGSAGGATRDDSGLFTFGPNTSAPTLRPSAAAPPQPPAATPGSSRR